MRQARSANYGPADVVVQRHTGWIGQVLPRWLWHKQPVFFTGWPDAHGVDQPFPIRYCCTWFASLPTEIIPASVRTSAAYAPSGRVFTRDLHRPDPKRATYYCQVPVLQVELQSDIRRPNAAELGWFEANVRPVLERSEAYSTDSLDKQLEGFTTQHVLTTPAGEDDLPF